jgi:hypothetical protein
MSAAFDIAEPRPWWERIPSGRVRLYLALVTALAVLDGAVAGGVHGGVEGAVNGGIFGVIIGPLVAYRAWSFRRNRQQFWGRLLAGALIEAAGGFLIGLAARFLAFFPVWLFAGGMALVVVMVFTYMEVIRREMAWAVRGAYLGATVAGVVGVLGGIFISWLAIVQGAPPAIALLFLFIGACMAIDGALAGAFWAAALRRCVRVYRSLRIRARCRRRRRLAGWPDLPEEGGRWDLGDVDQALAAGPKRAEVARLLLRALADGAQVLSFVCLSRGRACRLHQQKDGVARELVPPRLSGADLALELLTLGRPTQAGSEEVRVGKLHLQLGEHTPDVSVILRLQRGKASGELRLPTDEGLAEPALQALAEYQELLGDSWEESLAPIVLDRPKEVAPPGRGATVAIRLSFRWPTGISSPPRYPVFITFDGEPLGQASLGTGFLIELRTDVGNHLLQFNPGRRWPWTGRDYLVQAKAPGRYELRLRWSAWGTFHRRADVVALPAEKSIPAATPHQLLTKP